MSDVLLLLIFVPARRDIFDIYFLLFDITTFISICYRNYTTTNLRCSNNLSPEGATQTPPAPDQTNQN
jgi:hypothetical protein